MALCIPIRLSQKINQLSDDVKKSFTKKISQLEDKYQLKKDYKTNRI